jgi:hypothetical protein
VPLPAEPVERRHPALRVGGDHAHRERLEQRQGERLGAGQVGVRGLGPGAGRLALGGQRRQPLGLPAAAEDADDDRREVGEPRGLLLGEVVRLGVEDAQGASVVPSSCSGAVA